MWTRQILGAGLTKISLSNCNNKHSILKHTSEICLWAIEMVQLVKSAAKLDEFDLRDLQGDRSESTPMSYSLTCT